MPSMGAGTAGAGSPGLPPGCPAPRVGARRGGGRPSRRAAGVRLPVVLRGQGRQRTAAVVPARLGSPLQELQGREKRFLSTVGGEVDFQKARLLPAFALPWFRRPLGLGPGFQRRGAFSTAPAAFPWLSRNPGPSACRAVFRSPRCKASKNFQKCEAKG